MLHRFLAALMITGASFGVLAPHASFAQTPSTDEVAQLLGIDPEAIYRLPDAFVTNVTIMTVSEEGVVEGSFTIENRDTAVLSDLRYQVEILGTLPPAPPNTIQEDTAPSYDRWLSADAVSVLPGESKEVAFQYSAPRLPQGAYRLRVQLITSQARKLGWRDVPVTLGVPNAPFVLLQTGPLVLPNEKTAHPQEGVNVAGGSTLRLQTIAESVGGTSLVVTPHLDVYAFDVTGKKIFEQDLAPVTVSSGAQTVITVPVTAATTPDAYHGVLTLRDESGTRISSQAQYRWVVTGPSAKVVSAKFDQLATAQGAQAVISAGVVGPADRETTVDAHVTFELLDGKTTVGERTIPVTLGAGAEVLQATFTLSKNITNPGFRITIRDSSGVVLDTYEVPANLSPEELQKIAARPLHVLAQPSTLWLLLGILVVLAAVLSFVILRHRRPLPSMGILIMFASALVAAGILLTASARANGIQVLQRGFRSVEGTPNQCSDGIDNDQDNETDYPQDRDCQSATDTTESDVTQAITLFVNDPLHDAFYADKTNIPLNFRTEFVACSNAITDAIIDVRYNTGGTKVAQTDLPSPADLINYHYTSPTCPAGHFCLESRDQTGTLALPGTFAYPETTLQIDGKWWGQQDVTTTPPAGQERTHVWVNFSRPPEGFVDSAECSQIAGWARDPDTTAPITVRLYRDTKGPTDEPPLAKATLKLRRVCVDGPDPSEAANGCDVYSNLNTIRLVVNGVEALSHQIKATNDVDYEAAVLLNTTGTNTFEIFHTRKSTADDQIRFQSIIIDPYPIAGQDPPQILVNPANSGDGVQFCPGDPPGACSSPPAAETQDPGKWTFTRTGAQLGYSQTAFGTLLGTSVADIFRADLPFPEQNHGFQFRPNPGTRPGLFTGTPTTVFVHAVDALGRPAPCLVNSTAINVGTPGVCGAGPITCANRPPTVDLTGPATMCVNTTETYVGTAIDPDGEAMTYGWTVNPPSGVTAPSVQRAPTPNGENGTITYTTPGSYTVRFRATDPGPAPNTNEDTVTTNVLPSTDPQCVAPPTCTATPASVGVNVPATLTGSGGDGTYLWSAPPDGVLSAPSGSPVTVSYPSLGLKTVTVSTAGRTSLTGTCTVDVAAGVGTPTPPADGFPFGTFKEAPP